MLVSQAHSFVQQARLAITLAWVAGFTNIVTVLACGTVTSHVSGTASNLGHDVSDALWGHAGFSLFLLFTFLFGAMVSGLCTELGRHRGWASIYVLPIGVEAALLGVFSILLDVLGDPPLSSVALYMLTGLASCAMGLQNATITRISSGVVRTTHVTGVLTDLGLETAQLAIWLAERGRNIPPASAVSLVRSLRVHPTAKRLALLGSIVGSFALGAGLGTLAYEGMTIGAMGLPVAFLLWIIYKDVVSPIAEIEPSEVYGGAGGMGLPEDLAVYHLRKDSRRHDRAHRHPNLVAWVDRLPSRARVVVLDLADVLQLDKNVVLELQAALLRLRGQGRRLVIAGFSQEQYEQMRRAGAGELLDPYNVCSDLELAIARAINLLEEPAADRR